MSDLFPHLSTCVDEMVAIRSIFTELPSREMSLMVMNTWDKSLVRPSIGSLRETSVAKLSIGRIARAGGKSIVDRLGSDFVQQTLKDPYIFDFLTLHAEAIERDLESGLVDHIRKFLLEMGAGFAFVGQQVHTHVFVTVYGNAVREATRVLQGRGGTPWVVVRAGNAQ